MEKKLPASQFIPNLKIVSQNPQRLASGHRLCPGCGISIILKQALTAIDAPIVTANATGCSEICFGAYPYTSFRSPWIHSLFENSASVISGVESAWNVLKKRGKLSDDQKKIKFLAVGGDGATYDIGFQWLSGAIERGHDFVYICFDNAGYMNTGYQRSGSTPLGFHTHTSPAGKILSGKPQQRKPLTKIIAAHDLPYAAQCNPANYADLMRKSHRAFEIEGPAFLNAFSVCPTNWKSDPQKGIVISKLATDAGLWPLFEVDHGRWKINFRPKFSKNYATENPALEEFLSMQGRTKHLLKPENAEILDAIKKSIADEWNFLEKMEAAFPINSK
ncbi:pyruvate ferredoxin oxidoreductase [bacterium]|jgi:pyruvate ferredoxin oxidoreductase beta subunit|nr:pyruvate ferredoxin oxidoreductase [bacterium]MBT6831980.1 pyruvate ferredoxin oxidoreductase [bacterium]MBT6996780.1 pyruvate ferredoxin oxidoreductase [bacterium]MBT7772095.1 pyruvate ferredoxin oxidoreductase [bacterium]